MQFPEEIQSLISQALVNVDDENLLAEAVRKSLDHFAKIHPGRSVEVRVPPFRVVQILGGTTHRRGTPPAVVEMSPRTWLELVCKVTSWDEARSAGRIAASGLGSDLSALMN